MISKAEIFKVLKRNKSLLFSSYPIKSLGLFGSIARDDFNATSDIDILVDFERPVGIEFIDLADTLEKILHQKIDLVSRNGIKPKYFKEIEKDLIYV
jgi:predicted nucleotidyltransferase